MVQRLTDPECDPVRPRKPVRDVERLHEPFAHDEFDDEDAWLPVGDVTLPACVQAWPPHDVLPDDDHTPPRGPVDVPVCVVPADAANGVAARVYFVTSRNVKRPTYFGKRRLSNFGGPLRRNGWAAAFGRSRFGFRP